MPYINTELFHKVLADFAAQFKLGANKHILLAVDRAGWHLSREVKIPPGLHLTFLPFYSPQLQPAKRLWTLVDEPIVNQYFETLDDEQRWVFRPHERNSNFLLQYRGVLDIDRLALLGRVFHYPELPHKAALRSQRPE